MLTIVLDTLTSSDCRVHLLVFKFKMFTRHVLKRFFSLHLRNLPFYFPLTNTLRSEQKMT